MDQIVDGWFSEKSDLWPGQALSLQVEDVLHHERSQYQDVLVVQTKSHGKTLILDGIIQCTEHDEFAYQEMISFLPLCAHANPENVLIVGGGDGGVAREVSKHRSVKAITQVEIDGAVVEASRRHLPFMSAGFASPKLTLKICDGFAYLRDNAAAFDVIITDSSDPIGPAVNLFTESYFALLKQALKPHGIICSQAGTIWNDLDHVPDTIQHCRKHFRTVHYAYASVPSYPTGQIGFVIATDGNEELSVVKSRVDEKDLRYYNEAMHRSAFVLPNFAKRALSM